MAIDYSKRVEHHTSVAKNKMTKAELACKAPTAAERRCPTNFDFIAARDFPISRIKQGLKDKEWGKQELMAICSTRGLIYSGCSKETLETRLCEYADPKMKKDKKWVKKNMTPSTNLHKVVAAAISNDNTDVWIKKVRVPQRNHEVFGLVFVPKKKGISSMSSVYEEVLGYERVNYGQSGPFTDGNSASQLKAILTTDCNLQHHASCRNGNQGKNDDTNWDNGAHCIWSDYLHDGGVHPHIGGLPKMGKELDPLNRKKKGKGTSTTKKAPGGGGKKASKVENNAASLMEEEMESATVKDDKRSSRAAKRAKKKLEADAMPEEDGSKPAAKENEPSDGRKRKATGGRKKKDPNAPKKPRHAYTFYDKAMRSSLKKENPEASFGDISKMLSAQWKELEDKSEYERQAEEDKARHAREMNDYTPPLDEDDDAEDVDDAPKKDGPPVKRPRREIASYGPVEAASGSGKKSSTKMPSKWNDDEEEEEGGLFSASDLKLGKVVTFDDAEYDEQLARVYTEPCSKDKQVELQLIDEEGNVVEEEEEGESIVHVDITHITGVEEDPDSDSEQEEVELSEYEQERAQRVARNAERLRALGLA